jgi:hypothetical protein
MAWLNIAGDGCGFKDGKMKVADRYQEIQQKSGLILFQGKFAGQLAHSLIN